MKYVVIGNGLIAKALKKRLEQDGPVGWYPEKDTKIIFYFGGTVHTDFERNVEWHFHKELNEFLTILNYCNINHIKLVYPSSALVYEKVSPFTDLKKMMEEKAGRKHLGLRIFPVYGSGEKRTVISQWIDDIKNDRQPVVWGDGTQRRDFIYVNDVAEQALMLAENATGVQPVGTGKGVEFNEIIATINKVLGKDIKPIYKPAPTGYSPGILCPEPLPINTTLEEGITKICEQL